LMVKILEFSSINKEVFERGGAYGHFSAWNRRHKINVCWPLVFVFDEPYRGLCARKKIADKQKATTQEP